MERMQPKELSLFKASDGTAAVDMSVALVSEPIPTAPGGYASMTAITPAGPSGTWSAEDTAEMPKPAPGVPPNGKPVNGKGAPFTEKVS